ncbi:zinc-binding domain-containing protein [Aspergillus bertholletiae]|uniref:Zinc-binding domain-containing protein n=1 Tax=Aspergillus bertholletiae TaxID=1226010 RepID=A0A5N7BGT7_9EURO|nr:zinc-binding domain-containing protein [Aspergillus bertholletiae]
MPNKKPKRDFRWSMYPKLHDDVSRLLGKDNLDFQFHTIDDSKGCTEEYETNIMGRFICRNNSCSSSGWSSKKIAIIIRMYPGAKYNARVYHQRCKRCNALSRPFLDTSYAERVVYRLKKWRGVQMDVPHYSGENKGRPHNSDLCEGCKDGRCSAFGSLWL